MDNLLNIVLEAHNVERNHHRQYEIKSARIYLTTGPSRSASAERGNMDERSRSHRVTSKKCVL